MLCGNRKIATPMSGVNREIAAPSNCYKEFDKKLLFRRLSLVKHKYSPNLA
jgi:hypothetical protein